MTGPSPSPSADAPLKAADAAPVLRLDTPLQHVPGVGPRRAELFNRLEVRNVAELIKHLPHRYEYHAGQTPITQMPIDQIATARGMVVTCRWVPGRSSPIGRAPAPGRGGGGGRFQAQMRDDSGYLDLVWFNANWLRDKLHPGHHIVVTGKVVLYRDGRQMVNPKLQILPAENTEKPAAFEDERHRPVYPATEDLPTDQIERIVTNLLPSALPQIDDHFTPGYRESRALPELREAYRMLHAPAHEDEIVAARRRLAYDELLLLQLGFALKRKYNTTELHAAPLRWSQAIDTHIRDRFPFPLTESQDKVVREIAADLQRPTPMNRLLQGDVGAGKTVVALYALLMAVAADKQGCLMAPTELLAEQHYRSISAMLKGSTVRIALLTGSLSKPQRTHLLYRIERGEIDIVVGTQALLTESVQFADLALCVVDEQHRFGVSQRAQIKSKTADERTAPHTLVMTATPIPRTLSLTVFGDLDVSTIYHLPPGRQPIITKVVPPEKAPDVYAYVAKRVKQGEQAYIVLPAIEGTDPALKAVRSHVQHLERGPLKECRVAALHGQLKQVTRDRIMDRFRRGEIDVLVATTVIEVGVDVPNACMMIVEHAERFGLAQLHQLRGRVGRGTKKSLCVFIAEPATEDAAARMAAIAKTTNGFDIAEADLLIRGMGELLGLKQSGLAPFKVADLSLHLDLLNMARRDAATLVETDPKLHTPENDLLRKRLLKQYGEALGLADVA